MAARMDSAAKRKLAASQTPPMTNAEALAGLEAGLRTGLPVFSVLKYNPEVLSRVAKTGATTNQRYTRNFLSDVVPPTPEHSALETETTYCAYQMLKNLSRRPYQHVAPDSHQSFGRDGLVWSRFVGPRLLGDDAEASDWDD